MRSFSKKLAFVLAAAMVVTAFAPAAKAEAAKEMAINKSSQILYVNEGINHKGGEVAAPGKGNVSVYDFSVKNKPADWKTAYTFKWSSDNEDVVSVAKGGVATAVGVGKANVYCKVIEKATNEVTTLKTKVTVKANAYKVEISNADKFDGAVVEAGDVVDLNRTMYDEDNNKTTKRGTLVTDYTKWVASPSAGVEIDQKTGKFTFTEAAEAGSYELSCYTYQSSKYTEKTAEAEAIKVELIKEQNFEITQNSITKVTVNFTTKTPALNVADVAVTKMIGDYKYPQVVKSVAVAEDGMSAAIEVFNSFVDGGNYVVSVKGYEDTAFVASVGDPVRMEIVAVGKYPTYVLTTGEQTSIQCVFYDDKNVDVTYADDYNKRVSYKLEKTSTNGDFYLAGTKLTIKKNTASAVVLAKYLGKLESGKYVGALEARQEFIAVDAAAVVPTGVKAFEFDGDWNNGWSQTSLEIGDEKKIEIRLNHNIDCAANGYGWDSYSNNSGYNKNLSKEKITLTAITPDIADVTYGGIVRAHKEGVALFYVNYAVKQDDGKWAESAFAIIEVTVTDVAVVSDVKLTSYDIVVGTVNKANFDNGFISLYAVDQRGNRINLTSDEVAMYTDPKTLELKCLSDGYGNEATMKELAKAIDIYKDTYYNDGQNKDCLTIKVYGAKLRDILIGDVFDANPRNGEVASLLYEATFTTAQYAKLTVTFSVTVQEPGEEKDDYIQVNPNTTWIDLARINNPYAYMARDEKTITFDVFKMSNGIIVDTIEVTPYDADGATPGAYQYEILKDGQAVKKADVNHYTSNANGNWWMTSAEMEQHHVTVHPTTYKSSEALDTALAATGSVLPDYSKGGAGLYTFALYKWQLEDGKPIAVQQLAVDVTAVVNSAGEYKLNPNKQNSNHVKVDSLGGYKNYNAAEAANILECFTITDTEGKDVVKTYDGQNYFIATDNGKTYKYYVDYSAPRTADGNAKYVYVKEIVFFESLAHDGMNTNQYVSFVVPVDVALENR